MQSVDAMELAIKKLEPQMPKPRAVSFAPHVTHLTVTPTPSLTVPPTAKQPRLLAARSTRKYDPIVGYYSYSRSSKEFQSEVFSDQSLTFLYELKDKPIPDSPVIQDQVFVLFVQMPDTDEQQAFDRVKDMAMSKILLENPRILLVLLLFENEASRDRTILVYPDKTHVYVFVKGRDNHNERVAVNNTLQLLYAQSSLPTTTTPLVPSVVTSEARLQPSQGYAAVTARPVVMQEAYGELIPSFDGLYQWGIRLADGATFTSTSEPSPGPWFYGVRTTSRFESTALSKNAFINAKSKIDETKYRPVVILAFIPGNPQTSHAAPREMTIGKDRIEVISLWYDHLKARWNDQANEDSYARLRDLLQ